MREEGREGERERGKEGGAGGEGGRLRASRAQAVRKVFGRRSGGFPAPPLPPPEAPTQRCQGSPFKELDSHIYAAILAQFSLSEHRENGSESDPTVVGGGGSFAGRWMGISIFTRSFDKYTIISPILWNTDAR